MNSEERLVQLLLGLGARNALIASAVSLGILGLAVHILLPEEIRFHAFVTIAVVSTTVRAVVAHFSMPGDSNEEE